MIASTKDSMLRKFFSRQIRDPANPKVGEFSYLAFWREVLAASKTADKDLLQSLCFHWPDTAVIRVIRARAVCSSSTFVGRLDLQSLGHESKSQGEGDARRGRWPRPGALGHIDGRRRPWRVRAPSSLGKLSATFWVPRRAWPCPDLRSYRKALPS